MTATAQPWYSGLTPAEADARYLEMQNAAVDWQYLTVKAGGMARKSDLDAYLQARFGLDSFDARTISNSVDTRADFVIEWGTVRWIAKRPEPMPAALTPENNTEAAQQAAGELEQAEPMPVDALHEQYKAAARAELDNRTPATIKAASRAWAQYQNALAVKTSQRQPAMLDPIATLPLFSDTAPRVADPGRFDPPARSTDVQAKLF